MAIRIDNSEANAKLDETKRQLAEVTAEMKKLNESGKKNSAEYKALKKRQDELNTSLYRQRLETGRSALSYNELRKGASQLRRELNKLQPGTAEWKQYREELRLTQQRMKELQGTSTETRLSIGKLADGFNRYMGLAAGAVATLTGMTLTMRQCVDEYAKMEEAESQVIKYTGMTREEVDLLNERFKNMDTRTPREELNRLAGEAGKLGITGVDNVLQFVEAADMINVALGEDLGEEAVNQIGKLSQMFGDSSRSLKENMIAIGSAVNQVAQNTSASEPYLVQFTARMGGVGKQANMSVTDIMGFASALDQNMLRSEMASTALSGLIMRIYQEPAKYAKLAKMDVEQFTRLIQTDVNQAVLMFLESLNKMGGMAQIAPVLKEMQLSGAEAASVISTLAGNVDLVRREQENASRAFREGTSIVNEYTVQNNTVQAELDKARKKFQEVRIELGERLQPVMKNMISFGSLTVKGLLELIRIYNDYKGGIITVTASIAAYTVAVNASVIADKAKALWTGRVVTGVKSLFAALKLNPLGLVVSAATAAATALAVFHRNAYDVTESLERMNGELANEQRGLKNLFTALEQANPSSERRRDLIRQINEEYGSYLPYLLDEKSELNEIKLAYDRINTVMTQNIALKHRDAEISKVTEDAASEQIDILEDLRKAVEEETDSSELATSFIRDLRKMADEAAKTGANYRREVAAALTNLEKGYMGGKALTGGMKSDIMDYMNSVYQLGLAIRDIEESYKGWIDTAKGNVLPEVVVTGKRKQQKVSNNPDTGDDDTAYKQELAALGQRYREEQNRLKKQYYEKQLTQEEYQRQMYLSETEYLADRMELLEEYKMDTSEVQGQIYDRMIAEADRKYKEQQKQEEQQLAEQKKQEVERQKQEEASRKAQREKGLAEIAATTDADRQNQILQALYDADLITYEEYQRIKTEIAEKAEDRRRQTATQAMQAVSQAASAAGQLFSALQEREISQVEARYDKQIEEARKAGKDTTKLEEEKEAAVSAVKMKYADKQFAANVLQIASDTAVGIMRSYAQMGPILGSIFAALVAAQGAIQIAVAKQQRDEAKGLYTGGYSGDYVQGYTEKGNPHDTAGVIPVHKNEFVANHEAVANPDVRQFLDVFDLAQKRGTIRMLNTTQILEQVRIGKGRYSGGYSADNTGASRPSASPLAEMTSEQRSQVVVLLQENNRLLTILTEKELVVDPRKVRDSISHIKTLESNISRRRVLS